MPGRLDDANEGVLVVPPRELVRLLGAMTLEKRSFSARTWAHAVIGTDGGA